jgi:hypothetical protein
MLNYSQQQLEGFGAEAAARRKKVLLAILAVCLPLYGALFAIVKRQLLGIGPVGWLAIAAAVAVAAIWRASSALRCPACGRPHSSDEGGAVPCMRGAAWSSREAHRLTRGCSGLRRLRRRRR